MKKTITVLGTKFEVEANYSEGDVLKANEASALNQTLVENIRNNVSAMVKKAAKTGDSVSQEDVDAYVASYEFGARAISSRDPVEAKMKEIARTHVKKKIIASGLKISEVAAKDITAKVAECVAANEAVLRAKAIEVIAALEIELD